MQETRIFIGNPFAGAIDALVTQPLPIGITILATDGAVNGSTITWAKHVEPADIVSVALQFVPTASSNSPPNWSPATLRFREPTSGTDVNLESNAPRFRVPPVVSASISNLTERCKTKGTLTTCMLSARVTLTNVATTNLAPENLVLRVHEQHCRCSNIDSAWGTDNEADQSWKVGETEAQDDN